MLITEHGGLTGLRDEVMLDSALNRPKQKFTYEQNSSIFDLAASYSYGLIKNHPFVDGNKRIALIIAVMFLELNGHVINTNEAEAVVAFEQLSAENCPRMNLLFGYASYVD